MKSCIFAGTFDPFTAGHYSICKKALELFDNVYVAIGVNGNKTPYFSLNERLEIIKEIYKDNKRVKVVAFDGLLVDFMKENKIKYNVRGIRNSVDLEYESELEKFNIDRYSDIITLYFTADENNTKISSTVFREMKKTQKDYTEILQGLPQGAIDLIKKFTEKK